MARKKKEPGNWKIHQDCGVCQKPKVYKAKVKDKEIKKVDKDDGR